jgi:hypothetical protein
MVMCDYYYIFPSFLTGGLLVGVFMFVCVRMLRRLFGPKMNEKHKVG